MMVDDRPRPRRRRWLALVAVLLLLAAGSWVAHVVLTRVAKNYILEALSTQLELPVAVDRLTIHYFPPALALERMRVGGPDQESAPLLEADAVTIRFSALSLLTDQFVLNRMTIERPRVALSPSRIAWIAQRRHEPERGRPDAFSIRRLSVTDGSILYADASRDALLTVARLGAEVNFGFLTSTVTVNVSEGQAAVQVGAWRQEFASVGGQATWSNNRLALRSVSVRGPDGHASLDGTVTFEPQPAAALAVAASLPLRQLSPWLPASHAWSGTVEIKTDASGAWDFTQPAVGQISQLSLTGAVRGTNLTVDDLSLGSLSAPFTLRHGWLTVTGLDGTLLGGTLGGDAALALPPADPQLTADLRLTNHQVGPAVRQLFPAIRLPDGQVSGRLMVSGNRQTPRLELRQATWTTRRRNQLTLHGTIEWQGPLALTVALRVTDLGEISDWMASIGSKEAAAWEGTLAGDGSISGNWADPRLAVELTGDALTIRGAPIDDARATVLYQAKVITLKHAAARQGAGRVTGSGTISLDTPGAPQLQLTVAVADGDLGQMLRFFGVDLPIEGTADGTLALAGTPGQFRLHGPARVHNGTLFGQPIAESELTLELTPDTIDFPRLTFTEGTGTVRATGRIGFDGSYQVDATIAALPLERLHWLSIHAPKLGGRLAGRVTGAGTWAQPNLHAKLELVALTTGPVALGPGALTLQLAGERLDVSSSLKEPQLSLSGTIRLRDDFPATAKLSVTQFPFALLLRLFIPAWPERITLTASGAGELSGSLRRPADLDGHFQFSELTARLVDFPIANDGPLALRMERGRVIIERARFSGEGTTLAAEGSLTLLERYDLFLHGEAELAILRLFFPNVTYGKGKGYLALQITDDWLAPKMVGGVNIQDGLIRLETVDQPLTVAHAGLFFDGRQLVLDTLNGAIGKGTVQASGRIVLERFLPADYRLSMEIANVPLTPVEGFSGVVDGSLWLQGELAPSGGGGKSRHVLKGDLQFVRAVYSKRIDLKSLLAEQPTIEAFSLSVPSFLQDVTLQVHFRGHQSAIQISNNLANIPLGLDLDLRGTVEHPVLLGRISTTAGTFNFLHTPFQVSAGSIDFIDPKETKAVVDLKAQTTVRDYAIELSLTGTMERFLLTLSSDPPLSEADILSVLTVGRTTQEATIAGAGSMATSGAAALLVDEFVEERVQQLIGIDRFEINSVVDRSSMDVGPQLTIGKQLLNNRLVVLYSTPLDPTTEALLKLEYEVNRHFSLIGERDDSGRFGGDLKFRFDFR